MAREERFRPRLVGWQGVPARGTGDVRPYCRLDAPSAHGPALNTSPLNASNAALMALDTPTRGLLLLNEGMTTRTRRWTQKTQETLTVQEFGTLAPDTAAHTVLARNRSETD
eukprot:CAMPEP_0194490514 /NCGR_PEP_ID=MMETSP0253-20130528/9709_1 /TAXON_ID=2966 /ORGANISM="Noctiluca scintillans" /LENGTH=111 /DNA_ID=CAMNT_0039331149 /DNA_START=220 /DNA_END=552 /DNA_ORIENTATION=-